MRGSDSLASNKVSPKLQSNAFKDWILMVTPLG